MKRWLAFVLLAGCQSAAAPPTSPSPTAVVVSESASPVVTASAPVVATAPVVAPPVGVNEAVRAVAQFVHHGMTNQGRCDMLVAHLNATGKNQLWLTWECYPAATGSYEVTYVIEPMSNFTSGKTGSVGKRGNPFDRPKRVHNNGVYLEWLYDARKGTCVARNERTSTLMELKPVLDEGGLERALPAGWRGAPVAVPPVVVAAPVIPVAPAPSVSADPVQFTGFLGEGRARRAVLTQSGETFAVGAGDKVGGYRVKSVAEDELELAQGEDTVRLMPGQVWTP